MKFNILDYSQRISISLGLDLKDLHILGWIQDFWPEMKKKIIDGEEYGWIQYSYFIRDMPIVEINTPDGLYRRLKNLEKIGLLKHKGVKNSEGSFSYYKITEKIVELLKDKPLYRGTDEKSDGKDRKPDGADEKSDQVGMKSRIKDPSSNNPSTKSLSLEEVQNFWKELKERENYKFEFDVKKFFDWCVDEGDLKISWKNILKSWIKKPENQIAVIDQTSITDPEIRDVREKLYDKIPRYRIFFHTIPIVKKDGKFLIFSSKENQVIEIRRNCGEELEDLNIELQIK